MLGMSKDAWEKANKKFPTTEMMTSFQIKFSRTSVLNNIFAWAFGDSWWIWNDTSILYGKRWSYVITENKLCHHTISENCKSTTNDSTHSSMDVAYITWSWEVAFTYNYRKIHIFKKNQRSLFHWRGSFYCEECIYHGALIVNHSQLPQNTSR